MKQFYLYIYSHSRKLAQHETDSTLFNNQAIHHLMPRMKKKV